MWLFYNKSAETEWFAFFLQFTGKIQKMAPEEHQVQRPTTARKWTGLVEDSRPAIATRGYLGIAALSQWRDDDENETEYRSTSSCRRVLDTLSILIKPAQFFCINLLIRLPSETLLPSGEWSSHIYQLIALFQAESLPEVCVLHKGDGPSGAYGIVGKKRSNGLCNSI